MKALLFALLLCAGLVQAKEWRVDPAASMLGFRGTAQGESFDGRFKQFEATIRFDPADLAGSRFEVRIATASADTANAERDETLLGGEFFDSAAQPTASYVAERFETAGPGHFRALGQLTLRGITKPVTLDFEWKSRAEGAELIGSATLDRLDFNIGTGDWADPDMIGRKVDVSTRLQLAPAK